jgi:hypothetical protein
MIFISFSRTYQYQYQDNRQGIGRPIILLRTAYLSSFSQWLYFII